MAYSVVIDPVRNLVSNEASPRGFLFIFAQKTLILSRISYFCLTFMAQLW